MKKNILIFMHNDAIQFIDVCNQYTRLFDPDQYDVTVVYLSGDYNHESREKTLAKNVIYLEMSKKNIRGLKLSAIKKMLQLCREKKFDMVFCHRYKPTYIMLCVSLFCQIPLMFFIMHEIGTLSSYSRKLFIAATLRKNMIFAGVSNAVRDDMRQNSWRIAHERIITLYNMMDIDLTEPKLITRVEARDKLNLSENDFVFGNIGRLVKNKDQKTLIHAFAKIKPYCQNAKLIIVGDGQLEQSLKSEVNQLGLNNDVIFTGFIFDAYQFMKAFDVYISSSIQEAFGRVLLEAMLARLPIIATAVNGVPEVVGDAGALIPSGDPDVLAEVMLKTYHLPEKDFQSISEKSYQRVANHFSLKRFQEIFSEIKF